MKTKTIIIGFGDSFDVAKDICKGIPRYHFIEIKSENNFQYDLNFLEEFDSSIFSCAVALDSHSINFPRISIILELTSRGYTLESLISHNASISDNAKILPGVIIGRNTFIQKNVIIGLGSIIFPNVIINSDCIIKSHVSILSSAIIESNCNIGLGTTIGQGVILSKNTVVGRHCELLRQDCYMGNIEDRTYYDSLFPKGMRISS